MIASFCQKGKNRMITNKKRAKEICKFIGNWYNVDGSEVEAPILAALEIQVSTALTAERQIRNKKQEENGQKKGEEGSRKD